MNIKKNHLKVKNFLKSAVLAQLKKAGVMLEESSVSRCDWFAKKHRSPTKWKLVFRRDARGWCWLAVHLNATGSDENVSSKIRLTTSTLSSTESLSRIEWSEETPSLASLTSHFPRNPTIHGGKRVAKPDVKRITRTRGNSLREKLLSFVPTLSSPRTGHLLVFVRGFQTNNKKNIWTLKCDWESTNFTETWIGLVASDGIFNLFYLFYRWEKLACSSLEK